MPPNDECRPHHSDPPWRHQGEDCSLKILWVRPLDPGSTPRLRAIALPGHVLGRLHRDYLFSDRGGQQHGCRPLLYHYDYLGRPSRVPSYLPRLGHRRLRRRWLGLHRLLL
jgi:hypothetical protein